MHVIATVQPEYQQCVFKWLFYSILNCGQLSCCELCMYMFSPHVTVLNCYTIKGRIMLWRCRILNAARGVMLIRFLGLTHDARMILNIWTDVNLVLVTHRSCLNYELGCCKGSDTFKNVVTYLYNMQYI